MKTKTISFFNSKGGVGKSVLTNTCANEIKFQCLKNGVPCEIIVFDCDPQQTISKKREEDIMLLKLSTEDIEKLEQNQQEYIRQMRKRYMYYSNTYNFTSYDICTIDTSNKREIEYVHNIINENKYTYIFFDLPGTLEQEGTSDIFSLIENLYIPLSSSDSERKGTEKFIHFLEELAELGKTKHLQSVKLILNQTDAIKERKYNIIIQEFREKFGLSFFSTWINRTERFDTNTIHPVSTTVNLSTFEENINPLTRSACNLANEIITSLK